MAPVRSNSAPDRAPGELSGLTGLTGLTSLIGREAQLAELLKLAGEARLVTLLGPGGIGKSRLLFELGSALRDRLLAVVRLESLPAGGKVGERVGQSLGLESGADLLRALSGREGLLLLDNCEHLAADCAALCESILRGCPGVTIAASSREPLGVGGELRYPVQPLGLPAAGATQVAGVRRSASVRLFEARAELVSPGFAVTAANAATVAAICSHLEGLPLAIELAAASLALMPVDEVWHRLSSRRGLPAGADRGLPARQRSLAATLDWSYELLSDAERALFRRLSIFEGGFDLDAVEEVTVGGPVERPELDLFAGLVGKSLVAAGTGPGGRARYRLLGPVREYAQARLDSNRERPALARAHARHYLAGLEQGGRLDLGRLALDEDNHRAALTWLAGHEQGSLPRAVAGLGDYWMNRGGTAEGGRWLERALAAAPEPSALRAELLSLAGQLAWRRSDFAGARSRLEEALAIARGLSDPLLLGRTLGALGFVLFGGEDRSAAAGLFAEELALARRGGDPGRLASALNNLAILALHDGDQTGAAAALEECVAVLEAAGSPPAAMSVPVGLLGRVQGRLGNHVRARLLLQRALSERIAEERYLLAASGIDYLAELAASMGQPERAMTLFGIADRLYAEGGAEPPSLAVESRERGLAVAARRLGGTAAVRLRAAGAALDREAGFAFALGGEAAPPAGGAVMEGLSERELEVARLVADGLTNRQVAEMLSISVRTVGAHLEHVRGKLGVHSRAEIAAWLARR